MRPLRRDDQESRGWTRRGEPVEADAATKQVKIAYDPERVSLAEIQTAMAKEGYPVQE